MEKVINASRKIHSQTYNTLKHRRNTRRVKEKEVKGTFFLKTVISLIVVASAMAISTADTELTNQIKVKLKDVISQNVSIDSVTNSIVKLTDSFSKTKTTFQNYENEYKVENNISGDFRIDEDILNKMNQENDIYYINQQKN